MYSLNDDLTPLQFEELRCSGTINPNATYQDFLALQAERSARAAEARQLGLTGDDPPDLEWLDSTPISQREPLAA